MGGYVGRQVGRCVDGWTDGQVERLVAWMDG